MKRLILLEERQSILADVEVMERELEGVETDDESVCRAKNITLRKMIRDLKARIINSAEEADAELRIQRIMEGIKAVGAKTAYASATKGYSKRNLTNEPSKVFAQGIAKNLYGYFSPLGFDTSMWKDFINSNSLVPTL